MKPFELEVRENNALLNRMELDDPFHFTRIIPKGWKAAWLVLRGKLELTVQVRGTNNAVYRAVMRADYTPDPPRQPGPPSEHDNCSTIQAVAPQPVG